MINHSLIGFRFESTQLDQNQVTRRNIVNL